MKTYLLTIITFLMGLPLYPQDYINDIDKDGINDTVRIVVDDEIGRIVCKLSSAQFTVITSLKLEYLNLSSGINKSKNGFIFYNNSMRAGYSCQFRYEKAENKIRLIGMSRYEFGNATNDGSGESSINLLTNNYIGNWNYYNNDRDQLISLPTIKIKMSFPKLYLEDFGDDIYFDFGLKCAELYHKYKDIHQKNIE